MKKLFTIFTAIVGLTVMASAQTKLGVRSVNYTPEQNVVHAQSSSTVVTSSSLSVLWLRDGLTNDYTAVAYPIAQIVGLGNRVDIVGLGAYDSSFDKNNVYVGTGLSLALVETDGWMVKAYAGFKGFKLGGDFRFADGKEGFVWGLGVSVPIK